MSLQGGGGNPHVTITGNASGVSNAVTGANNALAQLEQAVAQNWWGIRNLGLAFAALPAAVALGAGAAVKFASDWEDAMAGVERTSGLAGQELDRLESQLLDIARTRPVPTVEIAGIAEAAGALGVAQEDVSQFTQVVADLAATTNLTADTAATNLARIAGLTGVAGAGFDNLGSAVVRAGISTAATEEDIVNLANRIAGVADIVGLTADQVISLAAATRSAGVQVEAGGTAIQKTLLDINSAVANSAKEQLVWAKIARMPAEQFTASWNEDAFGTFKRIVAGFGAMGDAGQNVVGILEDLGITEQRQLRTILTLASAQQQTTNENLRLSNIAKITNDAFRDGTDLADLAAKRYGTLSSQLRLLGNTLFEVANGLGSIFLPALKFTVGFLRDFVVGVQALPTPLKAILGVLISLATILSAVAAGFLLLGPRLIIAVGAFRQLQAALLGAQGQMAATQVQMAAVGRQAQIMGSQVAAGFGRVSAANLAQVNRGLLLFTASQGGANAVVSRWIPVAQRGGVAGKAFGAILGRIGSIAGVVGIALTGLSIATALLGRRQREAQEEARKLEGPQRGLVNQMRLQAEGSKANVNGWLRQQQAYKVVATEARRLGISLSQLNAIIKGTSSQQQFNSVMKQLDEAMRSGDQGARKLTASLALLHRQWRASAEEAGVLVDATGKVVSGLEAASEGLEEVSAKSDEERRKLEERAQAHLDYVEAIFAQREASFAVQDALDNLNEAQEDVANLGREIASQEREIASAHRDRERAIRDVSKAVRDLEKSQEKLNEAEANIEAINNAETLFELVKTTGDASEVLREQQILVAEALRHLGEAASASSDEARKRAQAHAKALLDVLNLTNDLRDAQLRLKDAEQAVEDAEFQLLFLQGERAGQRDIIQAELDLAKAHNELADQTVGVIETQEELGKAPREAQEKLVEAQEDLVDSQDALIDSQERVLDADQSIIEAEEELADLRSGDIQRKALEAQLAYERALYGVAQANSEVRTQAALMRGETIDAGDSARILAEELAKVVGAVPDADARRRLSSFIKVLRGAPDIPDENIGDFIVPPPAGVGKAFDDFFKKLDEVENKVEKQPSIWSQAFGLLERIVGATLGTKIGGTVGAIAGSFFGPVGAGIGATIGAVIGGAVGSFLPEIIDRITDFAPRILGAIINWFPDDLFSRLPELFGRAIVNLLSIAANVPFAVGRVFQDLASAAQEALDGIKINPEKIFEILVGGFARIVSRFDDAFDDHIGPWFGRLPEKIGNAIGDIVTIFSRIGTKILNGIEQGLRDRFGDTVGDWFSGLRDRIGNLLDNPERWLFDAGKAILSGLVEGLKAGLGPLRDTLNWIGSRIPDWKGPATKDRELLRPAGNLIMQGLAQGIEEGSSQVQSTLNSVGRSIEGSGFISGIRNTVFGAVESVEGIGQQLAGRLFADFKQVKFENFSDAFESVLGSFLQSQKLTDEYSESVDNLGKALKDSSNEAETAEERQRRLREALIRSVEASERDIEAMAKSKIITDDAATKKRLLIQRLDELKAKFPELSGPIDDYRIRIEQIPDEKSTKIDADTQEAHAKIATLNQSLVGLVSGPRTIPVGVALPSQDLLNSAGRSIIEGIIFGINAKRGDLENLIREIGQDTLANNLANVTKSNSPSKVFAEIGESLIQGLALGIFGNLNELELAIKAIEDIVNVDLSPKLDFDFVKQFSDLPQLESALSGLTIDAGSVPQISSSQVVNNVNENITVPVKTDANPYEIANEIAWNGFVRPRR